MRLKCNKWLLYWPTSGLDPARWARFRETAIIMNELTPFVYQKGPKLGSSATFHYLPFAFYLIKSLYINDCLKVTDQVQISIINDPKCYNNVILYNPCLQKCCLCVHLLNMEVRALCRVQGSTDNTCSRVGVLLKGTLAKKSCLLRC